MDHRWQGRPAKCRKLKEHKHGGHFRTHRQLVGTSADWAAHDLVIGDGELAVERAPGEIYRMKVGNGASAYSALPYMQGQSPSDAYLRLTGGVMTGPITLSGASSTGLQAISKQQGDALYVAKTQLTATGGTGAQNGKVPQLDANGLLSTTFINVPGNIVIKAAVAPTSEAPPAVTGDAYVFTPDGILNATWTPVGGTAVKAGDMAVKIARTGACWLLRATRPAK